MVDKAINNRISEISNTVLDKLGNNLIEKYLDKQDEKHEKLEKLDK
ncbi:hypothetical protein B0I68_000672 [Clostridium beijerinckii]|nr:hypothetical protein [Clostridium beijerinckii]NRT27067.1 hypothetical protein [Clostridium beijerinckii]NRU23599.1 hypothetical protein [Clostridium beijerinckii]NRW46701.1 hypothetical protein [Clostridium beijerinckii]NSA01111.1 hypothetical protein [Clostridium beijerinckii]